MNPYAGMAWDPVNLRDPTGRFAAKTAKRLYRWMKGKTTSRLGRQKMINSQWGGKRVPLSLVRADTRVSQRALRRVARRHKGIEVPYIGVENKWAFVDYENAISAAGDAKKSGIIRDKVSIGSFSGDSGADVNAAWRKYQSSKQLSDAEIKKLKKRWVMHHNLDGGELIMVDKDVHNVYRHTGGDGLQRHGFYDTVAGGIVGFLAPNAQNAYSSKKGALDLTMNVLRDVVENVPLVGDAATGLLMGADEVSARKRAASTPQHVIIEDEIDRTQDWLDHHCSAWPGTPGCD